MLFLPDTPRWYYAKGREQEGDTVLAKLHDRPFSDAAVQTMKQEIMSTLKLESEDENKFNIWTIFWDNTDLRSGRRIRISFLILSIQQMIGPSKPFLVAFRSLIVLGINLSVYYSTIIFQQLGLSDFLSQLLAAVMNTMFAVGTYPLPATIERFGRRAIMMWSALVLAVCLTIFVILIGLPNPTVGMQWGAVAVIIVYNFAFGYGWVGVPWLYGPEVG
jgi:Na+/melibiose symporter-like transporter